MQGGHAVIAVASVFLGKPSFPLLDFAPLRDVAVAQNPRNKRQVSVFVGNSTVAD